MALDAVGLQQPLRYDVDIKSSLIRTPMTTQLMKGDRHANRVIVAIKDGKENVDLSGVTVTGSFIRPPDDAEIPLVGIVNGNEAIVVLEDVCYAQEGYCEIGVMLTVGSTSRTILTLTGHVLSKGSGAVIDVGGVIPNINDIIAQYDEMKRVTQATQAAANAANEAASRAPYVGANGNWYVWNAASGSYIDSGSKAQGPVGPQGPGAEIDDTLSQSGKAADAKKTGEALSQLSEQKANESLVSDAWVAGVYSAGTYCIHNNILYRAERDTSAEPGDSSDWTQRSITDELTPAYEWLDGVSVRRCGHVAYLSINAESVKENGMTLATLPAYLAQAKYVYTSKVYNGSEYVDCCVMLRDGVIDIIDFYGQAIPGVVPAYLRTKDFTIIF